jgi:hypothetical protein
MYANLNSDLLKQLGSADTTISTKEAIQNDDDTQR